MEKKEIDAEELYGLLESISKFVDKKVRLYALGGTALTILGIKRSTIDIDLNIATNRDYDYLCNIFNQIGFEKKGPIRWMTQEGLALDVFHSSNILGTDLLSDCLKKSEYAKTIGLIEIFTLYLYDIIISKLARGDSRDFDDIKDIFTSKKIDIAFLIDRYKKTMETSLDSNYRQKMLDLIEIKFKEWNFPIDKNLIYEVKRWE